MLVETVIGNVRLRRPLVAKVVGDEVWDRASRLGWTSLELESFQRAPSGARVGVLRMIRALSLARADRIIAPSHYTARLIRRWLATAPPIDVIHNAAPDIVDRSVDPLAGVPRPRLVMAGRFIALKRVDGVVRALRRWPSASLVLVGSGEEEAALRALSAAEGVAPRVHFTGPLSQHDLLRVFSHADALVLNSTTENCPHVLLEAMAAGLPAVATRVGGVPELVEDGRTGWLIDPDDPSDLERRVAQVLADPSWREQAGARARQRAAAFAWAGHTDKVEATLRLAAGC